MEDEGLYPGSFEFKRCTKCGELQPITAFHRIVKGLNMRHTQCSPCKAKAAIERRKKKDPNQLRAENKRYYKARGAAYGREWRHNNRDRVRRTERKSRLKRYGLTVDDFERIAAAQSGLCAICCKPPRTKLVVDHDHSTGKVRGLLCHSCNTGMGKLGDDVGGIRAMLDYLVQAKCRA